MSSNTTLDIPATLDGILDYTRDLRYFHPEDGEPAAIPLHYVPGKVPLVLIIGPNAGGKSFLRRIVGQVCRMVKPRIEFMGVSMEFRTGQGAHAGNTARAFVFGDEGWESTGAISAQTVTVGIKTCLERTTPHVVFWDEPDIGLSEGYSRGVGQAIAKLARAATAHTVGVFVVTHSKPLVREMVALEPHYMHVGSETAPPTLQAWLDTEAEALDIDTLKDASHVRFQRIQKILNDKKRR